MSEVCGMPDKGKRSSLDKSLFCSRRYFRQADKSGYTKEFGCPDVNKRPGNQQDGAGCGKKRRDMDLMLQQDTSVYIQEICKKQPDCRYYNVSQKTNSPEYSGEAVHGDPEEWYDRPDHDGSQCNKVPHDALGCLLRKSARTSALWIDS